MAFRYPKNIQISTNVVVWDSNATGGTTIMFPDQPWGHLAVAPGNFPNIRKVTFWAAVSIPSPIPRTFTGRMRIYPASSVASKPYSLQTETIGAGTLIKSGGNPFNPAAPGAGGEDSTAVLFDRRGPERTINDGTTTSQGGLTIFSIEFDRFDATDDDFFAVWNSLTEEDVYTGFQLALEQTGGAVTDADLSLRCFGMEVVQAPAETNISTTYIPAFLGISTTGTGNADWDENQTDPVQGTYRLRFRDSDWDNIESISLIGFGGCKNNVSTTSLRVNRIDDDGTVTAGGIVLTTVHSETTPAWGGTGRYGWYRSADFKDQLVAGEDYACDWKHDNNPASAAALSGEIQWFWEIRQRDFTRTTTTHDARTNGSRWRFGEPNNNALVTFEQSYFDPLHYEDIPDASIIHREIIGSLRRLTQAFDPTLQLYHSAFLEGAEVQFPLPVTAFPIAPFTQGFNASPRWQWDQTEITANDPLNLAGVRRLFWAKEGGHTWSGINNDHAGALYLLYSYDVPNEEVPELGPLFELDAFNPEGCAATSAGLGDNPAVLVITNGSTIPQKFNPTSGRIENAGIQEPFEDEVPSATTADTAASPTGGLVPGIYTYRYTFCNSCTGKESDPNPDDIVVDASTRTPRAAVTLSFAGVVIPGDAQIDRICIYRTVVGGDFPVMAKVGYIDLDVTTLFTDTLEDDELDFTNDPLSLLNGAMPCVPIVVEHKNRLVGMGDIPNLTPEGTVSVINGSQIVTGSGTEFSRCDVGKLIQIGSDCRKYEIARLLAPEAGTSPTTGIRLKLSEPYEGATDTGLLYTICGRPNRVYFSEPFEAEYWPAANFLDVDPGDGDRLMGAVSNFDAIVICKRSKSYRVAWRENPVLEIVVPTLISRDVGCIAPRSFAQVASGSVWLADRGIAVFDGRSVMHLPESDVMNDLFVNVNNPRYVRRDSNGRVIGAAGAFYPAREQYLLLLPTVQTTRGANVMVCWDVSLRNITIFEFCQEFVSIEVAKDASGNQRVYLGDDSGFVWMFDIGTNDGVGYPNSTGTVRGTVTRAGVDSLGASFFDDDTASFLVGGVPELAGGISGPGLSGLDGDSNLGLAGACVYVRANENDPWKQRKVFVSNGTRVWVTPSWGADLPARGWQYMLGPIEFFVSFKPTNFGTSDFPKRSWRHAVEYVPQAVASQLQIELLTDFEESDPVSGQQIEEGRKARVFDMSHATGKQVEPVEREIHHYMQVRLRNFAPDEPIKLLNHILMQTPKLSR